MCMLHKHQKESRLVSVGRDPFLQIKIGEEKVCCWLGDGTG